MGAPSSSTNPPKRVDETAALNGGAGGDSTSTSTENGKNAVRAGVKVAGACAFVILLLAGVAGWSNDARGRPVTASLGARVAAGMGGRGSSSSRARHGNHRGGREAEKTGVFAAASSLPILGPEYILRDGERGHWGAARASEREVDAVIAQAALGSVRGRRSGGADDNFFDGGEYPSLGTTEESSRNSVVRQVGGQQGQQQGQGQGQQGQGQGQQGQQQQSRQQVVVGGAACEMSSAGDGENTGNTGGGPVVCVKYAADTRQCSHTDNWLVDSCLRITELPQYFKRVDLDIGGGSSSSSSPSSQLSKASLGAAADTTRAWLPYPKWLPKYYSCVNGEVDDHERPYRIPAAGRFKPSFTRALEAQEKTTTTTTTSTTTTQDDAATGTKGTAVLSPSASPSPSPPLAAKNTAYVYAFVHVPKAAGSYLTEILRAQMTRLKERNGGWDPRHTYWSDEWYKPVMDLTEPNYRQVVQHYMNGAPGPQASPSGMAASYRAGHREMFKGSLAMGFCDVVHAPCAYITVLREPVERLLSSYAYLCLEGSEDKGGWTEEWKAAGRCPLDPVAYFEKMGGVEVGVQLMAPRGNPGSRCALEAAKHNLVHGCTRYLLMEKLEDGIKRLGSHLPDFEGFGTPPKSFKAISDPTMLQTHNGSKQKLSPEQAKRMERYRADPAVMSRLRELAAHEIELYEFAVANYEAQFEKDLMAC